MKRLKQLTAFVISAVLLVSTASLCSAALQKKPVNFSNTDFQQPVETQPADGGSIPGFIKKTTKAKPQPPANPMNKNTGIGYEVVDKPTDNTLTETVSGEKCLHFWDTNAKGVTTIGGADELAIWSEAQSVEPDMEYTVKISAMILDLADGTQSRIRYGIYFFDESDTELSVANNLADIGRTSTLEGHNPGKTWPNEFKDYKMKITSPANAAKARVQISSTPLYMNNAYIDDIEVYTEKEEEPEPAPGMIRKEVFNGDFEQPVILPEAGLVPGWVHRENIIIPTNPPTQIYQGEGIGYETVDKPASMEGSVTPSGMVTGEKCLHFYDFNYSSKAYIDDVWNELYLYSDAIAITAETEYHVAFDAMVGDVPGASETRPGRFKFGILYYDNQGEQIGKMGDYVVPVGANDSPSDMTRPVDQWKKYCKGWVAPAGAMTAKIVISTTGIYVANIFIDNMEFYSMSGTAKNPIAVNNADFSLEKQETPADLAPGWSVLQGSVENAVTYAVVEKPTDLTESSTAANDHSLKLTDTSSTEAILLASKSVPVKQGITYQVGFDALVSGSIQVGLMFFGADDPLPVLDRVLDMSVETVEENDVSAQWKTITHSAQAPEGAAYAAVVVKTDAAGQAEKAFVDNITVTYEFSGSTVQEPLFRLNSGEGMPNGISGAAGEMITVSVPYINGGAANQTATVIVGVFGKDHRMLSMKKTENAMMQAESDGEWMLEVQVPEQIDGNYVKVIVIDGLERLNPIVRGLLD